MISIIIPVYNVQKYLPLCVESILSQTFHDIELILIDDGSTDTSGHICDVYALISNSIKVVHQKNKGVSAARNAGIKLARGKYLLYVDSDDIIEPDMLYTMYCEAKSKMYDVVVCGAKHYDEDGNFLFEELTEESELDRSEMLKSLFEMPNPLGGCVWNKLFLKEKVKDVLFEEGATMAEDRMYLFDVYLKMDTCKKISKTYYHVLERKDSATHQRTVKQCKELLNNSYRMSLNAKQYSHELESMAVDKYLDDCLRYIPEMIQKTSQIPDELELIQQSRIQMKKTILGAFLKRKLPMRKLHGYFNALNAMSP